MLAPLLFLSPVVFKGIPFRKLPLSAQVGLVASHLRCGGVQQERDEGGGCCGEVNSFSTGYLVWGELYFKFFDENEAMALLC